jgi:hypothetical protein
VPIVRSSEGRTKRFLPWLFPFTPLFKPLYGSIAGLVIAIGSPRRCTGMPSSWHPKYAVASEVGIIRDEAGYLANGPSLRFAADDARLGRSAVRIHRGRRGHGDHVRAPVSRVR